MVLKYNYVPSINIAQEWTAEIKTHWMGKDVFGAS
jgi:hypothetical protein